MNCRRLRFSDKLLGFRNQRLTDPGGSRPGRALFNLVKGGCHGRAVV